MYMYMYMYMCMYMYMYVRHLYNTDGFVWVPIRCVGLNLCLNNIAMATKVSYLANYDSNIHGRVPYYMYMGVIHVPANLITSHKMG